MSIGQNTVMVNWSFVQGGPVRQAIFLIPKFTEVSAFCNFYSGFAYIRVNRMSEPERYRLAKHLGRLYNSTHHGKTAEILHGKCDMALGIDRRSCSDKRYLAGLDP